MDDPKVRAYRIVGYVSVVFSTVSILALVVSLPALNSYVRQARRQATGELHACRGTMEGVYNNIGPLQEAFKGKNRTARAVTNAKRRSAESTGYDFPAPALATDSYHEEEHTGSCDGCCLPGPSGAQGAPGRPGTPGRPGAPGPNGNPGRSYGGPCSPVTAPPCTPCPAGRPGSPGRPGPPGHDGAPGDSRHGGLDGAPGEPGPSGAPGEPGRPGKDGHPGRPGRSAHGSEPIPGHPGRPGRDGPRGPPGEPGRPGNDGRPGGLGHPGRPGSPGRPGPDGHPGEPGKDGHSGGHGERGICPKYCALDGGIFFEDGTKR